MSSSRWGGWAKSIFWLGCVSGTTMVGCGSDIANPPVKRDRSVDGGREVDVVPDAVPTHPATPLTPVPGLGGNPITDPGVVAPADVALDASVRQTPPAPAEANPESTEAGMPAIDVEPDPEVRSDASQAAAAPEPEFVTDADAGREAGIVSPPAEVPRPSLWVATTASPTWLDGGWLDDGWVVDAMATGERRYPYNVGLYIETGGVARSPDASRVAIRFGYDIAILDLATPDDELVRAPVPSPQLLGWNDEGLIVSAEGSVYRLDHDGSTAELIASGIPDDIWSIKPAPMASYLTYIDDGGQLNWLSTLDGPTTPVPISSISLPIDATYEWSKDEHWFAFMATVESTGVHVWSPLAPDEPPLLVGPEGLTASYGFSPDGTRLLIDATDEIWIRHMDSLSEAPSIVAASPTSLAWSPTGDFILYTTAEDGSFIVPVAQNGTPGAPLAVPGLGPACPVHWADASSFYHLACESEQPRALQHVEIDLGDPPSSTTTKVLDTEGDGFSIWNGRCLLEWTASAGLTLTFLESPTSRSILEDDYFALEHAWAPDGSGIAWTTSSSAHFAPIDPETCTFTGGAANIAGSGGGDFRGVVFLNR